MKCDICSKEADKVISYCIQITNLSQNRCEAIHFRVCEKCDIIETRNNYSKFFKKAAKRVKHDRKQEAI